MSKKAIAIYIDNKERYDFFQRVGAALESIGYKVLYLTPRLSIYLILSIKRKKIHCLKYIIGADNIATTEVAESVHVLANYQSIEQAREIYNSVLSGISEFFGKNPVDMIFSWNGSSTISMAIKAYAQENHIGCRFFEISNLGAKIFVDTEGVNAQSYLFEHSDILDSLGEIDEQEWILWKAKYLKGTSVPKQALIKGKISATILVDVVGFWLGCIREDYRNPILTIKNKFMARQKCVGEMIDLQKKDYCFLPLQVSNDTQILINSDYSNENLILEALELCKKQQYELIVKIHPAELNKKFISTILKMETEFNFSLARNDTIELVKRSKLVVVNNSTVGLEAMILEKPIKVYGRALYSNFDSRRLRAYILRYLIDMDYFDAQEPIGVDEIKKIIELDRWSR